jgi:hypothetical protein
MMPRRNTCVKANLIPDSQVPETPTTLRMKRPSRTAITISLTALLTGPGINEWSNRAITATPMAKSNPLMTGLDPLTIFSHLMISELMISFSHRHKALLVLPPRQYMPYTNFYR